MKHVIKGIIEEKIKGTKRRRRRCKKLLDYLKGNRR
jgi:hypothetical protein